MYITSNNSMYLTHWRKYCSRWLSLACTVDLATCKRRHLSHETCSLVHKSISQWQCFCHHFHNSNSSEGLVLHLPPPMSWEFIQCLSWGRDQNMCPSKTSFATPLAPPFPKVCSIGLTWAFCPPLPPPPEGDKSKANNYYPHLMWVSEIIGHLRSMIESSKIILDWGLWLGMGAKYQDY